MSDSPAFTIQWPTLAANPEAVQATIPDVAEAPRDILLKTIHPYTLGDDNLLLEKVQDSNPEGHDSLMFSKP
jgi:hypothetical protein